MNVYLGRRVKDRGSDGLNRIPEVKRIADAIIEDCIDGTIDYRKAMSRMNLLELIVTKQFRGRNQLIARDIVDKKREELYRECA